MTDKVGSTFEQTVEEGEQRVGRSWPGLLATGLVGGLDVSIGVLALLLVVHETNNTLLGALGFSTGFICLSLANSELFTENFLVPIAAAVAGKATARDVGRLWLGTLVMNLLGGWVMMGLIVAALPDVRQDAVTTGSHLASYGINWSSFALALIAGSIITLMTWMEHSTTSTPARLVAAIVAGFLLAAGAMNHVIVASLEMFGALHAGAPFGYLDWLGTAVWAGLGNIIGGIGLVTMLRLVQVEGGRIKSTRS